MYVGYTKEHEAFRDELRAYYAKLLTPEAEKEIGQSEGVGPVPRRIFKQMAADGWVGLGWPKEFGGKGLTPIEQYVFFDESMRAGAPVPMLTINSVAPTIMRYGSQEQKDFFIPKILAGEIHFAIGYTEADAGTDLASLKTTAVRDGDEYVINGQKVFTSLASDADYIWLAVRTDPNVKKHKGISIIIVPTDTPGFSYKPIENFGKLNTNITYYEDVRVRRRTSSARRTRAGRSSPTSSTTSASPCARRVSSNGSCTTCASGRSRRSSPTAGASSTRSGCSSTSRACTRGSSS
jgi:alkylation response protein AidB-like acyl-CoA dehydrogenase